MVLKQCERVAVLGIGKSGYPADPLTCRAQRLGTEKRFNAVLDLVGQFGATEGEELNPVIGS
jgi:hypothetical protein